MKIKLVTTGLVFAIAAGSFLIFRSTEAQPEPQGPPPAPVRVSDAMRTEMSSVIWIPGTIVSRNDARIASEVSGRISWMAEVGDFVREGEPLVHIDNTLLELQKREAAANIGQLEANLKYLEQQLVRQQQLRSQNLTSSTDLEEAQSQADIARQQLEQSRVTLAQRQYQFDRAKVLAPFSGKVVERLRRTGEFMQIGGEVVRLVDIENIEVRGQAPLAVTPFIFDGMDVTIRDRQGRELLSNIRTVVPVGDDRSRMIEVRVAVSGGTWAVGTPVRVALPQSDSREVIAVHRDAVILRENTSYLYKVIDDGTVEQITITTGIENGAYVEVNGEISPGDRIVIRGGERLQAGQAVTILAET